MYLLYHKSTKQVRGYPQSLLRHCEGGSNLPTLPAGRQAWQSLNLYYSRLLRYISLRSQ